jgi:hypothetical protein
MNADESVNSRFACVKEEASQENEAHDFTSLSRVRRRSQDASLPELRRETGGIALKRSKMQGSTTLFTMSSPNLFEMRVLTYERLRTDGDRVHFVTALRSTVDDRTWQATVGLRVAGFRFVENQPISVLDMTVEYSDRTEKYLVTTSEAIVALLSVVRPGYGAGLTNQRLRRKWRTQHMFRFSAKDTRALFAGIRGTVGVKSRTGLVLIEWPASDELIGSLTGTKQARSHRPRSARETSINQHWEELERLQRENVSLRAELAALRDMMGSLSALLPPDLLLANKGLQQTRFLLSSARSFCMDVCAADRAATLALGALSGVSIPVSRTANQHFVSRC